ncbi:MAG: SprT-like domain-containing protein [Gemmatimonadaceae bacterium]|nr:SprT-like domain-containing protein [Gemmatimonadaceae bacterium]
MASRAEARAAREAFLAQLVALGLRGIDQLVLTRNRSTVVSVKGGVLRVQQSLVAAGAEVHEAIVTFVMTRHRAARDAARRVLTGVPLEPTAVRPRRRRAPSAREDAPVEAQLQVEHARFNRERFAGLLPTVPVRVSRRMRRRLGHYTPQGQDAPCEIAIAWRHLRRDPYSVVLDTLLHEMVHQWQDVTGGPVDHGPAFRAKAREVGVVPSAVRRAD